MAAKKGLTEDDIKSILALKVASAIGGGLNDAIAQSRVKAEQYYKGEPFGDEKSGRSKVVSRDVAETVDGVMPSMLKVFAGGDEVARFDPTQPQEEAAAKQATDYVNWIWNQQNDGFTIFHSWFHDGLLKRNGIIKITWEEAPEKEREDYKGLSRDELLALLTDNDLEPTWLTANDSQSGAKLEVHPEALKNKGLLVQLAQKMPDTATVDACFYRGHQISRVRIVNVPPDEFLIDRRAASLDEPPFLGHRRKRTLSDLIEQFPEKKDLILQLSGSDGAADFQQERMERFADEAQLVREDGIIDPMTREVWVLEGYLRADMDGDGWAELLCVFAAGYDASGAGEILSIEEVDDHPFAALTPLPLPHKFWGMSMADQVMDLQQIKSALWRGALDSVYLANAPQIGAVENQVNLDDLLNRRPGGIVRIKTPTALVPIPTVPVAQDAYQMIEYADSVREQRTGVTRYNQGLDADTLNKTATGVNLIQNASQQRTELIARVYAETGVKRAFRRILELVCKHQKSPMQIQLRGEWAVMDPREWNSRMHLTVTVGLGTGNKDQQLAHVMTLLQLDQQIALGQGGMNGPVLTWKNLYAKLRKAVEAAGLRSVEAYYTDPGDNPQTQAPPQPQADPAKMAQVQATREKTQSDAQAAAAKLQSEERIASLNAMIQRELGWAKIRLEAAELGQAADQFKVQTILEAHKADVDRAFSEMEHARADRGEDRADRGENRADREQDHAEKTDTRDHQRSVVEGDRAHSLAEKSAPGYQPPKPKPVHKTVHLVRSGRSLSGAKVVGDDGSEIHVAFAPESAA